jgi:hypothetical protein
MENLYWGFIRGKGLLSFLHQRKIPYSNNLIGTSPVIYNLLLPHSPLWKIKFFLAYGSPLEKKNSFLAYGSPLENKKLVSINL